MCIKFLAAMSSSRSDCINTAEKTISNRNLAETSFKIVKNCEPILKKITLPSIFYEFSLKKA